MKKAKMKNLRQQKQNRKNEKLILDTGTTTATSIFY